MLLADVIAAVIVSLGCLLQAAAIGTPSKGGQFRLWDVYVAC